MTLKESCKTLPFQMKAILLNLWLKNPEKKYYGFHKIKQPC